MNCIKVKHLNVFDQIWASNWKSNKNQLIQITIILAECCYHGNIVILRKEQLALIIHLVASVSCTVQFLSWIGKWEIKEVQGQRWKEKVMTRVQRSSTIILARHTTYLSRNAEIWGLRAGCLYKTASQATLVLCARRRTVYVHWSGAIGGVESTITHGRRRWSVALWCITVDYSWLEEFT